MGVLDKRKLRSLLSKPGYEIDSLVISPLLDAEEQLDKDSIDIRLGNYFIIPKHVRMECVRVGTIRPEEVLQMVYLPFSEEIKVPAHGSVLGSSFEYIKLPFNVSAQVLTKSSWGRYFLTIATATWVHPGYRGCLTFELLNSSNVPIALKPGTTVGQLIFFDVDIKRPPKRDVVKGKYIGPIYPEYPKHSDDEKIPSSLEEGKVF